MHPAPIDPPEVQRIEVMGDAAVFHPHLSGIAVQAGAGEAAVRLAVGADAAGGKGAASVGDIRADDGADLGGSPASESISPGCGAVCAAVCAAADSADDAGRPVPAAIAKMRGMIGFR